MIICETEYEDFVEMAATSEKGPESPEMREIQTQWEAIVEHHEAE